MLGVRLSDTGVVILGDDERARAWRDALAKAPPSAGVLVSLPPRKALAAANDLAHQGRRAVIGAPLHGIPTPSTQVRVAHGWTTLHGWKWLEHIRRGRSGAHFSLEIHGTPDAPGGDLSDVLIHALAAVRRIGPVQQIVSAAFRGDGVEAEFLLDAGDRASLKVLCHSQRFDLRVGWPGLKGSWSWRDDVETVSLESEGKSSAPQSRRTPDSAERAVRQLIESNGDDLVRAAEVMQLNAAVRAKLQHAIPLPMRALRESARAKTLFDQLGLAGELPPGPPVKRLGLRLPTETFELWSFRAGLKPVAFLTVRPGDEERVLRPFGDVHVERLDRNVQIGAQDQWKDDRTSGEARVELYVSREAALARRAVDLQARRDPQLLEMGELLGYPKCCVEAFTSQPDRSNNTWNRYATAARTTAKEWPWELNNLVFMLLPFFPCRYDCPNALAQARAALAEMAKVYPDVMEPLRSALACRTLYFDHPRRLLLQGRTVVLPDDAPAEFEPLASAIAAAGDVELTDEELRFGQRLLTRTDPGLGFLAPFR